ncbi:MAG: ribonuclease III [Chloroflexi bacterium]|nr:ribonuclease III [Chloroflexota bacterium]
MTNAPTPAQAELEALLGVVFRQSQLLTTALTHSSFVNEYVGAGEPSDNERLEFLGDAVLGMLAADLLYKQYPHLDEGSLTQLRAALVKAESLAMFAQRLRLGKFLRLGVGEERTGGRERESILSCGFEAVIGAFYLDRGTAAVERFLMPLLQELLDEVLDKRLHLDARSELHERLLARRKPPPAYRVRETSGPEHNKRFLVEVGSGDDVLGSGIGKSKRGAAQAAARDALLRLDS